MKKLLFAVVMLLPMLANAEKVGIVNAMAALQGSDKVQQHMSQLDNELKSDGQKMQRLQGQVRKIQEKLQKENMTMSQDEVDDLRTDAQQQMIEIKSLQRKLQKKSEEGQREIMNEMGPKLQAAVEKIAKQKGLDVVVNAQAVVYAQDGLDITDAVSDQLNN